MKHQKNTEQKIILVSAVLILFTAFSSFGQLSGNIKNGLKYYISADSSQFIQLNMTSQLWARQTWNDPGTVVQGTPQSNTTDFSVRRIRFVLSGQLSDRVAFFVQYGQNNINYLSPRKTLSFFHDVTADYALIKKHLIIGMGLNGYNGPSRFSNTSITSMLVLDPPAYQEVTNDTYDQFVRRLGVYAKGKIGKLDYRISVAKPFVIQTASVDPISTNSTFSTLPPNLVYQGYIMYQFLDQESNFGPGTTGTYLGKKKIFNIGGGLYYQQGAMFHYGDPIKKDTISQNMLHAAIDIFYDVPLNKEKGTALSVYACYSNYNYGSNFIKVTGPDNPASASNSKGSSFDKASYGNAFPYLGTGNVYYIQAGYKFKNNLLGEHGTLQPFVDCQLANYNRLSDPMYVYDVGVNWLMKGQNSKVTLNYQNRPYFLEDAKGNLKESSRYGELVMQYQVAF